MKIISAEHVNAAVDAIFGIDPSQAPTDPVELNERLTVPQPDITESIVFLLSQQKSKQLQRGIPLLYVLLEAGGRAFPEEMSEGIRSKPFLTSIAAVASESKAAVAGDGTIGGLLKERQPELVAFLERQLTAPESWIQKLTADDRIGLYALTLGVARAVERQLAGVEKPTQVVKEPGRNDPCSCGSGKKFKKCHGGPNAVTA